MIEQTVRIRDVKEVDSSVYLFIYLFLQNMALIIPYRGEYWNLKLLLL